jgi:beta-alanine--pyruvate transaminase
MTLKGLPNVLDIRTVGSPPASISPAPGAPGARAYEAMDRAFHDEGLMIRITGDTIALSPPLTPPLIVSEAQIGEKGARRHAACCSAACRACRPRRS